MPISATSLAIRDDQGRFLLGKRKYNKHNQRDHWCFPGGAQEHGETIEEAARRELYEETNLIAGRLSLLGYDDLLIDGHHYLNLNFYTEEFRGTLGNPEPDKFHEWRWFAPKDFPKDLTKACKQVFFCLTQGAFSRNNASIKLAHPLEKLQENNLVRE